MRVDEGDHIFHLFEIHELLKEAFDFYARLFRP